MATLAKSCNSLGNPLVFYKTGEIWDIPNVKANHSEKTERPCDPAPLSSD